MGVSGRTEVGDSSEASGQCTGAPREAGAEQHDHTLCSVCREQVVDPLPAGAVTRIPRRMARRIEPGIVATYGSVAYAGSGFGPGAGTMATQLGFASPTFRRDALAAATSA